MPLVDGRRWVLKETGSQSSVAADPGGWGSLAFKGYVDIVDELFQEIANLFIERYDSGSGDENEVCRIQESSAPAVVTNDGRIPAHNLINFSLYQNGQLRNRFGISTYGIY